MNVKIHAFDIKWNSNQIPIHYLVKEKVWPKQFFTVQYVLLEVDKYFPSSLILYTAVWTRPSAIHMENERVSWLHRAGHVTCVCGCSSESWHCSNKLSRDCRNNNILVYGISGCVHFPGSGKILLHGRVAGNAKVGVKFQNI